jgi:uncharacterized protein (DUF2147 family)
MRVRNLIAPALFALTFVPVAAESALAAPDPTGIWMNDTGRGAIEIKHCGNALCGNVVWVKAASDSNGCGKQIIGGVSPVGGGRWDNGWIYSPEKGRKYDVELTPLKNGTLRVTGYAGVKFLSKTMIWTRAPQDLQLCGQTVAKTETPAAKSDGVNGSVARADPAPAAPAPASPPEKPASNATPPPPPPVAAGNQDAAKPAPGSPPQEDSATTSNDQTAANDDDAAAGIGNALGKLKLGDLSLDKVLTKTKSGKCKLNTPWLKVQFDCEQ